MTSLWNTRGNEMTDATTRKNRDDEKFPHEKISRFYAAVEVVNTKVPWDDSPADKQANVEGSADGEPLTRRIFSEAETHKSYSGSEEAYGKQAYEAANVERATISTSRKNRDEEKFPHERISRFHAASEVANTKVPWDDSQPFKLANVEEGEPLTRRIFSAAKTHRNSSGAEEAYGKQAYEAANVEGSTAKTTRKNRDEEKFPHEKNSRFYTAAEVANAKVLWDDTSPDKQANVEGSADGESLTRRIFSEAETHRNYSEAEETYGKQAYEAANVEGSTTSTTRKNRDEEKFPHERISKFYAGADVVYTKVPWDDSVLDKQANVEDGEPLTHRIFSEAETRRNHSEAEEGNFEGSTTSTTRKNRDEEKFPHERISKFYAAAEVVNTKVPWDDCLPDKQANGEGGERLTRRIFSEAETHRNYSEAEEAYGKQAYEAANIEGGADVEKIATRAAAGIGTKIENYENIRTQRRHYPEAGADEWFDVDEELNANNVPTDAEEEEIKKAEEAARGEKEAEEDEVEKTNEAARVEKKKAEESEGVLSQRRHFPVSTTSNVFN